MGEPDENGLYRKYRAPAEVRPRREETGSVRFGWRDVVEHWDLVVPDLMEIYPGPPLDDSWLTLRAQIWGLIGNPRSRVWRFLSAQA